MRKLRYAFLTLLALAGIGTFLACSGSTYSSAPAVTVPPAVTTIAGLVSNGTNETDEPKELEALNLAGLDTEDEHAFDALFPAN
jgi:hypothetical protein